MADEGGLQAANERVTALEAALAETQAALAERDELIATLRKELAELTERVAQNSRNSHLPPSSDGPGAGKRLGGRRGSKSGRKRGGQKGRKGAKRELVDVSKVDEVVELFPEACQGCAAGLPHRHDPTPRRHQQVDIIDYGPWTTEWRRHAVKCPHCGTVTVADYDPKKIPSSAFGPRLTSIVVMLTGVYHISRLRVVQLIFDLYGISISVGTVSAMEGRSSESLADVHDEVKRVVEHAAVKHTDGTTWLRDGKTKSLWTISSSLATLYEILENGARETISPLFGALIGILVSDRASVFGFWVMVMRQICWAHLLRKFVSFSERDGPAGKVGRELLECTALVFDYWRGFKDGELDRTKLAARMKPVQQHFEAVLERAVAANIERVSGSCTNILAHRDALWNFVVHEGVDPTNNDAERALRPLVLWRKRSFGSKSDRGERFVARVMTAAYTARKQGKSILDFFEAALTAKLEGRPAPRLVERATT